MQYPTVKFCTVTESRIRFRAFTDVQFLKIKTLRQYVNVNTDTCFAAIHTDLQESSNFYADMQTSLICYA